MNDQVKQISEWEVLTPSGWSDFSGIKKTIKNESVEITTSKNNVIHGSKNHKIKILNKQFKYLKDLMVGEKINKKETIIKIQDNKNKINLYDLLNVEKNNEYITNNIISHNCAFVPRAEDLWTGALPTLSEGGQAIILSTPNGYGNLFHKLWLGAEEGTNGFIPIKLPWWVHPHRDQAWRDAQEAELGSATKSAQENDCDFVSSGKTVIKNSVIEEFYKRTKDPIEKSGNDEELWIWEKPIPGYHYIISADCATATGDDFSAAHVLNVETLEQVAEYNGHIDTFLFGKELLSLAKQYNEAILAIENNSIGIAAIQPALDDEYQNLYWTKKGSLDWIDPTSDEIYEDKKIKPGFSTTSKTRPLIIQNMDTIINQENPVINSKRLVNQFKTFVNKGSKAIALGGYNDDLILAYAIGLWARNVSFKLWKYIEEAQEFNRSWLIKGFSEASKPFYTTKDKTDNSYITEVKDSEGRIVETIDWSESFKQKRREKEKLESETSK